MTPANPEIPEDPADALARMERRLARIERILGLDDDVAAPTGDRPVSSAAPAQAQLEVVVGQAWFARIGIVVLAIGAALSLSLPWSGAAAWLPTAVGWLLALGLLILARCLRSALPLIAESLRAAGMALMFFATLRLCFFGAGPWVARDSMLEAALLALVVTINLAIAWRCQSPFLTLFALLSGWIAALAVGVPWYLLGMVTALTVAAGLVARSRDWPWLVVVAGPGAFLTYLLWALGNPLFGQRLEVVAGPFAGVWIVLLWMLINAVAMTLRRDHASEGTAAQVGALLNAMGYGLFLLHTLIAYGTAFVAANVVASLVLLGIAVMFWLREQSRFATFVYAMTGYGALTAALVRVCALPDLFVWLSVQSLLVVSTAIWFRSRFIVVANFIIYLAVVACYMIMVKEENGISLGLGLVALTSAGILNWRKNRLELKTELMRNAYLISAFFIFPHALHHIVPGAWVAPSWIGIAIVYYGMWLVGKSPKYRWMGHGTLILTIFYLLVIGIGKLEGVPRIVSFLALGSMLLVVSVVFTLTRARQARGTPSSPEGNDPPRAGG